MVSVQCLKPAFTADDEAPVAPPPVTPDSPRRRGRPQKVVAESSAVATPKRKKVTFKLKPKILNQNASTLKEFFIASLRLQPPASPVGGGVMWKTMPGRLKQVSQDSPE